MLNRPYAVTPAIPMDAILARRSAVCWSHFRSKESGPFPGVRGEDPDASPPAPGAPSGRQREKHALLPQEGVGAFFTPDMAHLLWFHLVPLDKSTTRLAVGGARPNRGWIGPKHALDAMMARYVERWQYAYPSIKYIKVYESISLPQHLFLSAACERAEIRQSTSKRNLCLLIGSRFRIVEYPHGLPTHELHDRTIASVDSTPFNPCCAEQLQAFQTRKKIGSCRMMGKDSKKGSFFPHPPSQRRAHTRAVCFSYLQMLMQQMSPPCPSPYERSSRFGACEGYVVGSRILCFSHAGGGQPRSARVVRCFLILELSFLMMPPPFPRTKNRGGPWSLTLALREQELEELERQIWEMEGVYIRTSSAQGNLLKGEDRTAREDLPPRHRARPARYAGYTGFLTDSKAAQTRAQLSLETDRIFSQTSVTSPGQDGPDRQARRTSLLLASSPAALGPESRGLPPLSVAGGGCLDPELGGKGGPTATGGSIGADTRGGFGHCGGLGFGCLAYPRLLSFSPCISDHRPVDSSRTLCHPATGDRLPVEGALAGQCTCFTSRHAIARCV